MNSQQDEGKQFGSYKQIKISFETGIETGSNKKYKNRKNMLKKMGEKQQIVVENRT